MHVMHVIDSCESIADFWTTESISLPPDDVCRNYSWADRKTCLLAFPLLLQHCQLWCQLFHKSAIRQCIFNVPRIALLCSDYSSLLAVPFFLLLLHLSVLQTFQSSHFSGGNKKKYPNFCLSFHVIESWC